MMTREKGCLSSVLFTTNSSTRKLNLTTEPWDQDDARSTRYTRSDYDNQGVKGVDILQPIITQTGL